MLQIHQFSLLNAILKGEIMKKYILFVCFAFFRTAYALNCYYCSGPACETETKTWNKTICDSSGVTYSLSTNYQYACLKFSYKDTWAKQKRVERKCILVTMKDGKPDYTCDTTNRDQVECHVCQTDLCNAAHRISFSFAAFWGVALAFLAPKLL